MAQPGIRVVRARSRPPQEIATWNLADRFIRITAFNKPLRQIGKLWNVLHFASSDGRLWLRLPRGKKWSMDLHGWPPIRTPL